MRLTLLFLCVIVPVAIIAEPVQLTKNMMIPPSLAQQYNQQLENLNDVVSLMEVKLAGKENIETELTQINDIEMKLDELKASLLQEFADVQKSHSRINDAKQHFLQKHSELAGYVSGITMKPDMKSIVQLKELISSSLPESVPRGELTPHICALTREPKIIAEPERDGKDRGNPEPTPEDTMETQEIQFTLRIQALAESLDYDPRKIYEYVRNRVHYQPYFGATRTAQSVLLENTGNDFDQSTLLIALLRVSDIPARYGYGIIDLPLEDLLNLLNVDSLSAAISVVTAAGIPYRIVANGTRVWLKHCFVKAYVPVAFYRGAIRDDKNKVWISFAPAYKRYEITEAFDVITEMDFNALEFFEEYIKNGRTIDPMILYRQKIEDYLAGHHPGMTYESIRRKTSITQEQFDILPFTTQPYLYYVYDEFSAIPDSFRQHVRISIFDEYGSPSLDTLLFCSELSGRRITLFYCGASAVDSMWIEEYEGIFNVPPYLLRLLPVLAVDGAIVAIGNEDINMAMIHDLRVEFINEEGSSETVNRELVAGAVHGLGMGMYSIGVPSMFDILPTDTLGCDTWIGKFSHDVVKRFFNDYDVSVHELTETNHAIIVRGNIFLASATQHNIEYIYGAPYTFEWTGYELLPGLLRLGAVFTDGIDNRVRKNRLRFLSGMCWSHAANQAILTATGTEAIDPMKLLTLSDSTMIPVYKITQDGLELLDEPGGRGASLIPFPDKSMKDNAVPSFVIRTKEKYVLDELILKFKTGGIEENRNQINLLANAQIIKTSRHSSIYLIKIAQPLNQVISELQKNPLVEYASPNYYVTAFTVPNDPHYTSQWHLQRIAAPHGWDVTTGDSSMVISILDTGLDPDHAEFSARTIPGYDFVNDDPEPEDDNGHGTHVTGIAGAATNNSIGIAGTDWQAKVMPLKVLNAQGIGTTFDVCEGIYYAADLGADIINLSLGGYEPSSAYDDAVNYAHASGCIVIAAAGNDNTNQPVYPGACAHVICVSATNKTDQKASFSNYGTYIDLAAPGVAILSTLPQNQYTYYNGTSMAAPLVSGLAALLCAQNPLFGPAEIESLLFNYADDLGEPGWDEYYGYGRINVFKSLVGPMPIVLGYYGNAVLGDGVATQGEQFGMLMSVVNTGDSTAYGVRATLYTSDPYVTIVQGFCRFGDIQENQAIVGIDTLKVHFHHDMPKDHKVRFALTIEDSFGIIYSDGFMIKEGEYLPGFIAPEPMKDLVRGYVNQGYTAYLPQGNLMYKDFLGTGFAANDLDKMDGQGGSAWYTYDEWWERFGASCVHKFFLDWWHALFRLDELLYVEVEVMDPEHDAAFPMGDTIIISMSYEAEFSEEPTHYAWTEDLIWNTSEPPNMGGAWEPSAYQFWPVEYSKERGFYYEENESRIWWLFTFEILENLVKKYFNPLKPDSARVVYQIHPMQYGDPDTVPNPIKMEVEIRDKDSVLVRDWQLSTQEQKDQVVFWDGKDNQGDTVSVKNNPFETKVILTYRNMRKMRDPQAVDEETELIRNNLDLVINEIDEEKEVTIGGFASLNKDDDNENAIPDKDETGIIANEDDLVPVTLKFNPEEDDGELILYAVTVDSGKIKIWNSPNKNEQILLPMTYELPSEFPKTLWVEGINTSNALRDVELVLTHSSSTGDYQDKVKITVFELDATHIAFNHDENATVEDAINMRKDRLNEVEVPEWGSEPDRNDPVAYIKDMELIIIKASFKVNPAGISIAEIMAEGNGSLGNLGWKRKHFQGGISIGETINSIPGFVAFVSRDGTGDSIDLEEITWQWKVKNIEESGSGELPMNSCGPCTVYTILAEPQPPWTTTGTSQVWSKVLTWACIWARGEQDEAAAVGSITDSAYYEIDKDHDYDYGITHAEPPNFNLTGFIAAPNGDCQDMSAFVHVLCRAIGGTNTLVRKITGDETFDKIWYQPIDPFGDPYGHPYRPNGWTLPPNDPNYPRYWAECWWGYHQVAYYSGVYDPTIRANENSPHIPTGMDIHGDYKYELRYYGGWDPRPPFSYTIVE
jgi:subtilisin family serine protease